MSARNPDDVDRLFADALNAGNLDALVALYEPNATLCPAPGERVSGHAAIREALAGFLAGKPRMTLTARTIAQAGDIALTSAQWKLDMTGADGKPATMSAQSVEVVHRQADGTWRVVIDEPFGLGAPGA